MKNIGNILQSTPHPLAVSTRKVLGEVLGRGLSANIDTKGAVLNCLNAVVEELTRKIEESVFAVRSFDYFSVRMLILHHR